VAAWCITMLFQSEDESRVSSITPKICERPGLLSGTSRKHAYSLAYLVFLVFGAGKRGHGGMCHIPSGIIGLQAEDLAVIVNVFSPIDN
jgi:hypothetical protein